MYKCVSLKESHQNGAPSSFPTVASFGCAAAGPVVDSWGARGGCRTDSDAPSRRRGVAATAVASPSAAMSIHSTRSVYSAHSVHTAYSSSYRDDERNAEAQRILYSDDGVARYRRPLRMPAVESLPSSLISELESMSYSELMETPLGRYHYLLYLQHALPAQGRYLLTAVIYMTCREAERPAVANSLCELFMPAIYAVYSAESPALHGAGGGGSAGGARSAARAVPKGAPSAPPAKARGGCVVSFLRSVGPFGKRAPFGKHAPFGRHRRGALQKHPKILEAKRLLSEVRERLAKRGALSELFDALNALVAADAGRHLVQFRRSTQWVEWAQMVSLGGSHVDDGDFFQFRVLGVGGFGEVSAAVKRDTGAVYAVKRMDKKLIKHKNRYKSCEMEAACLKSVRSRFVCGLHYTFQTDAEVCLVLDMLHGGTLSFLLHQAMTRPSPI